MTYGMGMETIRSDLLAPGLATLLLVLLCYISGRVHQFFKQTQEREDAYRDGYNTATKSLFSLATRVSKAAAKPEVAAPPVAIKGYASVPQENKKVRPAKHRAAGRREPGPADTNRYEWPGQQAA
jgi:hypothetical protein